MTEGRGEWGGERSGRRLPVAGGGRRPRRRAGVLVRTWGSRQRAGSSQHVGAQTAGSCCRLRDGGGARALRWCVTVAGLRSRVHTC